MKTCGYCGNTYDDREVKCPACGSTLVKHTKGTESAAEERERLRQEIERKRKIRNRILGAGALVIVLLFVLAACVIIRVLKDPQRKIARESKPLLKQARELVAEGAYDSAISALDQIDHEWEEYSVTEAVRHDAEYGIVMDQIQEYQDAQSYEELISYVDEHADMADEKIEAIYEEARQICKENTLAAIQEYINAKDYTGTIQYVDCLNNEMKTDPDVQELYELAVASYKTDMISEAETLAQSGDYISAKNTLVGTAAYIGSDQEITDKIAELDQREVMAAIYSYTAANDYAGALQYIDGLDAAKRNHIAVMDTRDQIVKNYKMEALNNAEVYLQAEDYTSARSVLSVVENHIGSDSDITEKVKKINEHEVTAAVLSLVDAGNYRESIVYMNDNSAVVSGSADLQVKLNTCVEKYRSGVIDEAKNAHKEEGYEAALDILKAALDVLKDDEVLLEQVEIYKGFAPVSLLSLNPFYSDYDDGDGYKRQENSMTDKLGNVYENCLNYVYGYDDSRDIYVINKQYKKFTGTIFVPEERKPVYDGWHKYHFSVYGDDVLLYQSPNMDSMQYPVDFEIDVSDVEQLSICWDGGACTWYCELGLTNAYLYK